MHETSCELFCTPTCVHVTFTRSPAHPDQREAIGEAWCMSIGFAQVTWSYVETLKHNRINTVGLDGFVTCFLLWHQSVFMHSRGQKVHVSTYICCLQRPWQLNTLQNNTLMSTNKTRASEGKDKFKACRNKTQLWSKTGKLRHVHPNVGIKCWQIKQ